MSEVELVLDRPVCWSSSGVRIAGPSADGVTILDTRTGARREARLPPRCALRFVDERVVVIADRTVRALPASGELDETPLALGADERAAFCATARGPELVVSSPTHHHVGHGATFARLAPTDRLLAVLPGSAALVATATGAQLLAPHGRSPRLAITGEIIRVDVLFGGRALAILAIDDRATSCSVVAHNGDLVRRLDLPDLQGWSVAGPRGRAIMRTASGELRALDLRVGSVETWACPAAPTWRAFALDPAGARIAATRASTDAAEGVEVIDVIDLAELAPTRPWRGHAPTLALLDAPPVREVDDDTLDGPIAVGESDHVLPPPPPGLDRPPAVTLALAPVPAWLMRRPRAQPSPPGALSYADATAHLDAMLALCRARAHRAIAREWSLGRLAFRRDERFPFEHEVAALAAYGTPAPSPPTPEVGERVEVRYAELVRRTCATLACGGALPLIDLADEHGLGSAELHVLLSVAAPQLSADIARLHAIAANSTTRAACDRALLRTLLVGEVDEAALGRILAPNAPLLRLGLIEARPAANWQFDGLAVRSSLLLRLLGEPAATVAAGHVTVRAEVLDLARFRGPHDAIAAWLAALDAIPAGRRDVRVVVQGPAGSGRRTLLDAVMARARRRGGFIDGAQLAALGPGAPAALRDAIRDAAIAGLVPCVVDPDAIASDPAVTAAIREILRAHAGPIALVARPGATLPVGPDAVALTLPAATASERLATWTDTVARYGLVARDLVHVATRLPAGPGTIERVCRATAAGAREPARDCTAELDAACRRQLELKLGKLATRMRGRPHRDELILPPDLLATIDELIARVRLRHVVYDGWGFGRRSSLRGLTALFYGPPGTGKSMVAGVIAAELELELYRVDLSAVTSKWLGETEKHLSELFDAAEGGEIVLLFDEADSLFAKRTAVETSHDRYANLETNYLLQRLDDFDGIALLTTNSEASIDDAFKRRLAFRIQFPFPDAENRAQLWTAHLPPDVPRAPDLDFGALAERYQLSGGNIRNCLLRAAFLAARDGAALDQARLLRTIESEYHEMGHISTTGRLT